jgi:hypothetical protein
MSDAELKALAKTIFDQLPPPVAMLDPLDTPESALDMSMNKHLRRLIARNVAVGMVYALRY